MAPGLRQLLAGLVLAAVPGAAQHVWYRFKTEETDVKSFSSYLRWTQAEGGDVYLATQFWTGCGTGYFGGQLHSDGTHMVLFSLWDYDGSTKTAHGVSPWCERFGGEGQGAHCGLNYVFEFGTEYRFEVTKARNGTGVIWSASVAKIDPIGTETRTFLGDIFVDERLLGRLGEDCFQLKPMACAFQEYYLGGDFYSAGAWRGPFLNAVNSAFDASSDCGPSPGFHANVSDAVPDGPRGRPTAFFQMGGNTPHGCGRSMWQHDHTASAPAMNASSVRMRPTATRPTGQRAAVAAAGAATARTTKAPPAAYQLGAVASTNPAFAPQPPVVIADTTLPPLVPAQAVPPTGPAGPGPAAPAGGGTAPAAPLLGADGMGLQPPALPYGGGSTGACNYWQYVIAAALGGGAGIRMTLPAFFLSLLHTVDPGRVPLSTEGEWLTYAGVTSLLGLLVLVETIADMAPALDHLLHVVLAPLHPVMGALAALAVDLCGGWTARAPVALVAGLLAFGVHSGKATLRAVGSGASCGMLNPCLSGCESIGVVLLMAVSILFPVVGLGALALFACLACQGLQAWSSASAYAASRKRPAVADLERGIRPGRQQWALCDASAPEE